MTQVRTARFLDHKALRGLRAIPGRRGCGVIRALLARTARFQDRRVLREIPAHLDRKVTREPIVRSPDPRVPSATLVPRDHKETRGVRAHRERQVPPVPRGVQDPRVREAPRLDSLATPVQRVQQVERDQQAQGAQRPVRPVRQVRQVRPERLAPAVPHLARLEVPAQLDRQDSLDPRGREARRRGRQAAPATRVRLAPKATLARQDRPERAALERVGPALPDQPAQPAVPVPPARRVEPDRQGQLERRVRPAPPGHRALPAERGQPVLPARLASPVNRGSPAPRATPVRRDRLVPPARLAPLVRPPR